MTVEILDEGVLGLATTQRSISGPGRRRRLSEDELAERIIALIRRNEALEDFATLVAHELKTSLLTASSDPSGVTRALNFVDELLVVARREGAQEWADAQRGLDEALRDVPRRPSRVECSLRPTFPLPHVLLRVVLRNLIANAVAAGARTVRIISTTSGGGWTLSVDDDGVGLDGRVDRRSPGNGLGLQLCRRIAQRRGGSLGLHASNLGGARATLRIPRAAR